MSKASSARTDRLLKVYLGLFAFSVALSGVLVQRHLAWPVRGGDGAATISVPRETPHAYGPTINWGGAKR